MTEMPPEGTWLDPDTVRAVLGSSLSAQIPQGNTEDTSWSDACDAVRLWVEDKRDDLWTLDPDTGERVTFEASTTVVFGASVLAFRWYSRRRSPMHDAEDPGGDILAADPDLGRMLGIGVHGRVIFGGPTVTEA